MGSCRAYKFSHTFPMEKLFNYSPFEVTDLTHVCDVLVVKSRQ